MTTQKAGLVDQIQAVLKAYRQNAPVQVRRTAGQRDRWHGRHHMPLARMENSHIKHTKEFAMTPLQYELHEARKERLPRMGGSIPSNVVPLSRICRQLPETKPKPVERQKETPKPAKILTTTVQEVDSEALMSRIHQAVAMRYRIGLEAIKSDSRSQFVILPRQIAYTMARRLTGKSLATIGRAFGGRDHTTVLHGVQRIEERASTDTAFAAELEQLEQAILGGSNLPCPCCGAVRDALKS